MDGFRIDAIPKLFEVEIDSLGDPIYKDQHPRLAKVCYYYYYYYYCCPYIVQHILISMRFT